jgi:hypothetical protein
MKRPTLLLSALLISLPACGSGESGSPDDDTTTAFFNDTATTETGETGDGDGDSTDTTGDGDGDTTGDGDGDTTGGDGDASIGAMLWVDDGHQERCGNCHGQAGQYPPEALAGPLTYAEILDQIVNGGGYMPPQVPEHMTMEEATHIAAYLESL